MITFKPKQVTKSLLEVLPDRARDVLEKRYGLGADGETYTLEAIGRSYGITRERVRQIENYGLQSIQKSEVYKKHYDLFVEMQKLIDQLGGGIIAEHVLLDELSAEPAVRNHIYFLLVAGDPFFKAKENPHYEHRWYTERKIAEAVEKALRNVYKNLEKDSLISESEIIERFRGELIELTEKHDEETLKRWLLISKQIGRNPLGDWGPADSPNIRVKGIRDYAYLAVKRHGSPMHFREVAESIKELFGHEAHIATTHNELIKDGRFVLVGRGLYALSEWGYTAGVVKDVLRQILETDGPLSRTVRAEPVRNWRMLSSSRTRATVSPTRRASK